MNASPLLSLHAAAGARLVGEGAAQSVLTFGDVPAEYEAGTAGSLLFDETTRGAVLVTGSDAPEFLHRILANDVRGLEAGSGTTGLLLSPKGKVRFGFELLPVETGFLLSTEPGQAADLREALDMFLFADQVELTDVSDEHAPITVLGPSAAKTVEAALGSKPPTRALAPATISFGGRPLTVSATTVAGSSAFRLDGGPAAAPDLWQALERAGARPGGVVVRDILRVEAGRALLGVDVDDTIYPQEARLEEDFSLTKGCYIGQEVVAKIDTYGGLNKRLCALRVTHDDPVQRGTRLFREDDGEWRDLGIVTSWAYSFVLDTGLVLAYLKRKHQAVGTEFRLGDGPATATVVELPVRESAVPLPVGAQEE